MSSQLEKFDFMACIEKICECPDVSELASLSVVNHHASGLFYLCLERSEAKTVKIYFIPNPRNVNGGYLVNPHNHRYDFMSSVLSGSLRHYRFRKKPGFDQIEYSFDWKTKSMLPIMHCDLDWHVCELHEKGDRYYTNTSEIHTIEVLEPTIIGIIQYEDTNEDARLYLHKDSTFSKSESRPMLSEEYKRLLRTVYSIIKPRPFAPRLCGFES